MKSDYAHGGAEDSEWEKIQTPDGFDEFVSAIRKYTDSQTNTLPQNYAMTPELSDYNTENLNIHQKKQNRKKSKNK